MLKVMPGPNQGSHCIKVESTSSQPLAPEPSVIPFVLLLSLKNEDFFADIHAHVLAALRAKLPKTH